MPRIVSAKRASRGRFLEVAFTNGVTIRFPIKWFADLRIAAAQQINACEVDDVGAGLQLGSVDADFSAETFARSATMMPPPTFERPDRPRLKLGKSPFRPAN